MPPCPADLVTIDGAAVNMDVQVSLMGSHGSSTVRFLRSFRTNSIVGEPVCIPASNICTYKGLTTCSPHPLQYLFLLVYLRITILIGVDLI